MDTRSKITTVEAARASAGNRPIQWVSGIFDPLVAEHVRRLRSLHIAGSLLAVVIENHPEALLPQRARAELVAALADVNYVALDSAGVAALSLDDSPLREALCRHIVERQGG